MITAALIIDTLIPARLMYLPECMLLPGKEEERDVACAYDLWAVSMCRER